MDASHLRHQAQKGLFLSFFLRSQLLILLVVTSCATLTLQSTTDYLQRQLLPHAQNTANSLALILKPHLNEGNLLSANSIIAAFVQSGEFREITLHDENGKPLSRHNTSSVALELPEWFVHLIAFNPPLGTAQITEGWEVVATVEVVSHPGLAYLQLWRLFLGLAALAVAGVALSLLMTWLIAQRQGRFFDTMERKLRMELLEHYQHSEIESTTEPEGQIATKANNISSS